MIRFNDKAPIPLHESKSLLELALDNKIEMNYSCGGNGTCGTCRVLVENYRDMPPRNDIEKEMAKDRGFAENERLSCQTQANIDLQVIIP